MDAECARDRNTDLRAQASGLLFDLLLEVAARHEPEIVPLLRGEIDR